MDWGAWVFEYGGIVEGFVEDIDGDCSVTGLSCRDFLAKFSELIDDAESNGVVRSGCWKICSLSVELVDLVEAQRKV